MSNQTEREALVKECKEVANYLGTCIAGIDFRKQSLRKLLTAIDALAAHPPEQEAPTHDCALKRGAVFCRECDLETIERETPQNAAAQEPAMPSAIAAPREVRQAEGRPPVAAAPISPSQDALAGTSVGGSARNPNSPLAPAGVEVTKS